MAAYGSLLGIPIGLALGHAVASVLFDGVDLPVVVQDVLYALSDVVHRPDRLLVALPPGRFRMMDSGLLAVPPLVAQRHLGAGADGVACGRARRTVALRSEPAASQSTAASGHALDSVRCSWWIRSRSTSAQLTRAAGRRGRVQDRRVRGEVVIHQRLLQLMAQLADRHPRPFTVPLNQTPERGGRLLASQRHMGRLPQRSERMTSRCGRPPHRHDRADRGRRVRLVRAGTTDVGRTSKVHDRQPPRPGRRCIVRRLARGELHERRVSQKRPQRDAEHQHSQRQCAQQHPVEECRERQALRPLHPLWRREHPHPRRLVARGSAPVQQGSERSPGWLGRPLPDWNADHAVR